MEYISREAVIDLITRRYENPEICAQEINNIPSADVAPVVHGHWEGVFQDGACSWSGQCSVCGVRNNIPPVYLAHYCPNCGAKMDH